MKSAPAASKGKREREEGGAFVQHLFFSGSLFRYSEEESRESSEDSLFRDRWGELFRSRAAGGDKKKRRKGSKNKNISPRFDLIDDEFLSSNGWCSTHDAHALDRIDPKEERPVELCGKRRAGC